VDEKILHGGIDNGICGRILSHLGSNPNQLNFLQLDLGKNSDGDRAPMSQFHALASVIRSTQTLSHIFFKEYAFTEESMTVFVAALQCNASVTCLSFVYCRMDDMALQLWIRFFKSGDSRIRELYFNPYSAEGELRGWNYVYEDADSMDSAVVGTAILAMVTASSVRILSLGFDCNSGTPNYIPLLKGMVCHESEIQLSKLVLFSANDKILQALVGVLRHSSSLQELVVEYQYLNQYNKPDYGKQLHSALCQNGVLQRFSLQEKERTREPAIDPKWLDMNRMAVYSQRNAMVPMLLSRPQHDDETARHSDLFLVPTLFKAMRPARRMAGHTMFRGLLEALGDACDLPAR
jgi:hypothetical protein